MDRIWRPGWTLDMSDVVCPFQNQQLEPVSTGGRDFEVVSCGSLLPCLVRQTPYSSFFECNRGQKLSCIMRDTQIVYTQAVFSDLKMRPELCKFVNKNKMHTLGELKVMCLYNR